MNWKKKIKNIPNWPKDGIMFKDISPLLADSDCFNECMEDWSELLEDLDFDKIIAIDSRGFIFGGILAREWMKDLILVRKTRKLPPPTISENYSLEYGADVLEMKEGFLKKGDKVIIIDDVLATGGTMNATINLVKRTGAKIIAVSVLIKLKSFKKEEIGGIPIYYLVES